ncbi:Exonuclease SbcC [Streptomyces misionensis JCM 4497]
MLSRTQQAMVIAGRRPHRHNPPVAPHRRPLPITPRRLYVAYDHPDPPPHIRQLAPDRLGRRRSHRARPRGPRHRRPRGGGHPAQGERQDHRRPGRQGPCAVHEGVRRHPEEGLRRL